MAEGNDLLDLLLQEEPEEETAQVETEKFLRRRLRNQSRRSPESIWGSCSPCWIPIKRWWEKSKMTTEHS